MLTRRSLNIGAATLGAALTLSALPRPAFAASASQLTKSGLLSLQDLYADQPKSKILADKSVGILVFPTIVKAGFIVGAQTGNGVLYRSGVPVAFYNISSGSFGLQAGAQSFSYALFFMKESALVYLNKSAGWSIGAGPSIVVLDKGAAASVTSTTLTQDVYAIPFGQEGLMAGIGLEGSKITQIHPGP
jgi:lipid-binding SYLF domain-containing protein